MIPDLRRRTTTALVYGAVVVAAVFAPPIVFTILLGLAGIVALAELWELRRAGFATVVEGVLVVVGLIALGVLRLATLYASALLGGLIPNAARAGGVSSWPYTLEIPYALLMVLFATWAADIFAYLGGSFLGRHKIAPRISPGKTWEGTLIGFAAATSVFLLMQQLFGNWYAFPLTALHVDVAVAIAIGPVGLAGDLLESLVKRRAGVKDSGTFLPGHGGILDRIDSLVATAPLALLPYLVPCCAPTSGMMGP
jgi:phosphatidate cytidylyltransferase